ncbi:MAG TPA: hypothetical protein VFX98_16875, partial [Longimicrobiaceae bacterium]|nr:hypothetical protein [Longimicrobiaceae bacterium]
MRFTIGLLLMVPGTGRFAGANETRVAPQQSEWNSPLELHEVRLRGLHGRPHSTTDNSATGTRKPTPAAREGGL